MSFTLYRPHSAEEALCLWDKTHGNFLAGGTVALVNAHRSLPLGEHVISLEAIPGWDTIRETADALLLGPLVTFDAIEQSPCCRDAAHALWQAACEVGGPQIRNRATVGGNLSAASPAADSAPALLALGAEVLLQSREGIRTLPLSEFFVGPGRTVLRPGELLCSIRIPKMAGGVSRFAKVGKRNALAVSCAGLAVAGVLTSTGLSQITIAAGSVAPTPLLCPKTSALLNAGALTPDRVQEAALLLQGEIAPRDDRWATAEYRRTVCGNLLSKLLSELKGDAL